MTKIKILTDLLIANFPIGRELITRVISSNTARGLRFCHAQNTHFFIVSLFSYLNVHRKFCKS